MSSAMMCDGMGEEGNWGPCSPCMPVTAELPPSVLLRRYSPTTFQADLGGDRESVDDSCAEERSGEDGIPCEPAAVTSDLQENLNEGEDEESNVTASKVWGLQEREPLAPDDDEQTDVTMGATEDVLDFVL
ncbi:hypothetical protein GUITHDRAFT_102580 [Guillardia theta CCMP2712]|uniref:Uncharacterized protein n=1 Tax=Guillardia theta (strain CCMP2712) TaxID=905079 RepID=L1JV53_GUITC|nr:hypothetical protein GUITHDRAFT_102580 [Guillardia theta CCMP2712]EKX51968.1 hypothetical protein GUITHDRAFT_102580 [Guillardia theta CCMP2712]|eukprot:XP_005838948.1 hypothetical protein GUITHDRAFT_102580 [Guillardia theta CCMP2712]